MSLHPHIEERLALPLIAAPMFLVSGPALVKAACLNGVIGAFPSLNARPIETFAAWLEEISGGLEAARAADRAAKIAPYAVNLIVHKSNPRLDEDTALTTQYEAPVVITSVGHPGDVVGKVHAYGGVVYHDVIHLHHARKAMEAGVDGIILVTAGAGGHAGTINPFTLIPQVREFFEGTLILAGALTDGRAIRAAQTLGADLAYMGTRFIATDESLADDGYRQMLIEGTTQDIVYTNKVSGIWGNFLRQSLAEAGIQVDIPSNKPVDMDLVKKAEEASANPKKAAWKEIWSAGQGVGQIHESLPAAELIARLRREYAEAVDDPGPVYG